MELTSQELEVFFVVLQESFQKDYQVIELKLIRSDMRLLILLQLAESALEVLCLSVIPVESEVYIKRLQFLWQFALPLKGNHFWKIFTKITQVEMADFSICDRGQS